MSTFPTSSATAAFSAERLLAALSAVGIDPLLLFDGEWKLGWANAAAVAVFNLDVSHIGQPASALFTRPELPSAADLWAFIEQGKSLPEWTAGDMVFVPRLIALPPQEQRGRDPMQPASEAAPPSSSTGMPDENDEDTAKFIPLETLHVLVLRDVTPIKKLAHNQNEFIRIVSHDLRSPITSMSGFASMLLQAVVGDLNPQQTTFVEKMTAGLQQMTALVENIQDAGRFDPDTGFYEMQRRATDLNDIVRRVVETHLLPAEKGALALTAEPSPRVPILNADANMLERAVTNLIDNAIKFTPNGGRITVLTDADGEGVWVGVRDTGNGIPPEQQARLFQRHVRLALPEHKRVRGSGLGLFIVRSVAQRHGGHAWVESEVGKGSTFFVKIPLDEQSRLF